MYTNFIFDLYGTLVDIRTNENKDYLWRKMQEFYGFHGAAYSVKELRTAYLELCNIESGRYAKKPYYEITIENVFRGLFDKKGVSVSDVEVVYACEFFRVISTKFVKLYDGVKELFDELKKREKKIYLLSNAQRVFTEPEIKYMGIWDYFDGVVISSTEGCKKPSSDFFNILIRRYDIDIKDSIMIGNDGTSDILGANNIGMDSLYIKTDISPKGENIDEIGATYVISDGDFTKIKDLLLK